MADWSDLPEGILDLVAEHIYQIKDMVVINSLCKSWQSTLTFESPKFPLLMLAEDDNQEQSSMEEDVIRRMRCFFELFTSKIYKSNLPEAYARKSLGTGFGWVLTIGFDLKINLLHPFSRKQISLPPHSTFTVLYDFSEDIDEIDLNNLVSKAVLSSSPHHESCVVMVLYGVESNLAFFRLKSKDKLWIDVTSPLSYYDLIYFKEQFYAVNYHGHVVVCDINNDDDLNATVVAPIPVGINDNAGDRKYLVELSGDLLLISRIYGGSAYGVNDSKLLYYTRDFLVFKMERCVDLGAKDGDDEYPYRWVKVNNLGNKAVFLGNNSSVSFPASSHFKANCIYFTDDNEFLGLPQNGGHDMGIFNMEDATIKRHYTETSHSKYSPSLWYI